MTTSLEQKHEKTSRGLGVRDSSHGFLVVGKGLSYTSTVASGQDLTFMKSGNGRSSEVQEHFIPTPSASAVGNGRPPMPRGSEISP